MSHLNGNGPRFRRVTLTAQTNEREQDGSKDAREGVVAVGEPGLHLIRRPRVRMRRTAKRISRAFLIPPVTNDKSCCQDKQTGHGSLVESLLRMFASRLKEDSR